MGDTTNKLSKRIKTSCRTSLKRRSNQKTEKPKFPNQQDQYNAFNTPLLDEKVYCLDTQF